MDAMISTYVSEALRRARYQLIEADLFCATVPGLRGVIATGNSLERCRAELVSVLEEWILVRVAHGRTIPALGRHKIEIRKAS
jgi:predicted RNase H-like HicB family nuclease